MTTSFQYKVYDVGHINADKEYNKCTHPNHKCKNSDIKKNTVTSSNFFLHSSKEKVCKYSTQHKNCPITLWPVLSRE
jgi:hypothetical protein